ncbi:type IX secretion system membrane protein PorP/SprF [Winogradskyella maritima]|uniref:Type IX secretion system membrane protein PorP/SprF n=1 Tax=Winogradskyella maritima TaxID=1517766 RepID=A0ABV8AHW6_9FLAO|nr:type IX secretion system membrane protein PorP/SprF [Winogradskyella maritima]
MKLNRFYISALIVLSTLAIHAQQLPQFTQYMFNTVSINPAYAGSRGTFSAVGLHRSQWVGIDGGPQTQTLSIHAPLKNEKVGVGFSFINDELGFENFTYLYGDFSYTIQTGVNSKLAFGLKAGMTSYTLDGDYQASEGANDQVIFGFEDRWKPNFGAGVYWHSDRWYLGLSSPRILKSDYNGEDDFEALERLSYYATAGYVFDLSEDIKLKPSVLMKATNGAPLSFDVSANFLLYDKFWIGGGYRFNQGTSALGGILDFQVSKQIRVGYAYEYDNSEIRVNSSGTHEVILIFEVFKSTRIKSPRYF